jgi:hypothetical protein
MGERPLIFSETMVQALLAGRKTQTRRILKPQPLGWQMDDGRPAPVVPFWIDGELLPRVAVGRVITPQRLYHHIGQRLWVKETIRAEALTEDGPLGPEGLCGVRYRADDAWLPIENTQVAADAWLDLRGNAPDGPDGLPPPTGPQRNARFMPRWASRITLTVTSIRVERIRDISEDDAQAEGVRRKEGGYRPGERGDHIGTFAALWDRIHAEQPTHRWDSNPYVVALGFTVAVRQAAGKDTTDGR